MSTTNEQRLRDALERTLGNFRLMLSQKPVRDAAETIAEAERALAQQAPTPAVSPAAPDDLVQRMAELMQGSMRLWAPSKNMWLWNMMVKTIAEAKCITSISEPAAPVDARDALDAALDACERIIDQEGGVCAGVNFHALGNTIRAALTRQAAAPAEGKS